MSEKIKDVEKMIGKVMKKKDASRAAAIDYMLIVATGRLAALWRYDESVPEGKPNKGVLGLVGRKKRAPKSPKIAPPVDASEAEKPAKKRESAPKKRKSPSKKRKPAPEQTEIAAMIAE